ncbi:hypothetical protein [Celerinatantimonas sp. YJH-8]|uniref:hypothetical protein n=1 Tax=Celerinatantimonas sp. YJH-8 TaxID=3228714 RepID=UPI0038C65E30
MKKLWTVVTLACFLLSGCATIVGDKTQVVTISSTPGDAKISVRDESSQEVYAGRTPSTITLKKSNGNYWGKKSYIVTISKSGYEQQTIQLSAHANGWYIAGNLVFGGLIGWFIVDPFNGAMYTLSPDVVNTTLHSNQNLSKTFQNNDGLRIVLVKDVPKSLRQKMTPVL